MVANTTVAAMNAYQSGLLGPIGDILDGAVAAAANISPAVRTVIPLTGDTITMLSTDRLLFVNPAGTIAALTVKLPPSPTAGEIVELSFGQVVTALTVQDAAAGAVASTAGAIGVAIQYRFVGGAWVKWR